MDLLQVQHISKHYKKFDLQDISFSLPAGYILGYVGENGAGKTTTLNIVNHLIHGSEGTVVLDGITYEKDPVGYKERIGYIGDSSYFPQNMTLGGIRMILKDFYKSFRPDVFDYYVEKWNLPEKKKIKDYSRGMKVKLMFASVLSRDTKLLILDEATNGLDPIMRKETLGILQDYISDGERSVLFSTHILEDLEQVADYIFFIHHGKKIFYEAKDELLERYLLVKGGQEELTPSLQKQLIGMERYAYGFEALFDTENGMLPPSNLVTDQPSIDQIIVHMIEEMEEKG